MDLRIFKCFIKDDLGRIFQTSTLENSAIPIWRPLPRLNTVNGALVRIKGWPSTSKNFRIKRGTETWARVTEDEMVRGLYLLRTQSENVTLHKAIDRYLAEVTPTKAAGTQTPERYRAIQFGCF